jgi:type IV secretory pathway VirB3-like protein
VSNEHATGQHTAQTDERFIGRTAAVVLGVVLMVCGLGMGVTTVMLPIGLTIGINGLLLILWAVFYATPYPEADVAGAGAGHGHGTAAGRGPSGH